MKHRLLSAPKKMIVSALTMAAMLALPKIASVAQTPASSSQMPIRVSQRSPMPHRSPMHMSPEEMHQNNQQMMGQMQQMMTRMQETMADMNPEQIDAMSRRDRQMMMQMEQMMNDMDRMERRMNHYNQGRENNRMNNY